MSAASLSLLTGGKKAAIDEELGSAPAAATAATTGAPEEGVEVDIDVLSAEEVEQVVKDFSLDVPQDWASLTLEGKKVWLKSQAEDAPEAAAATPQEFKCAGVVQTTGKPEKPKKEKAAKAAKPKSTGTEVALTQQAVDGEIVAADALTDLVHEIETMNEKDALQAVTLLADETEKTFFKLGGVLSVIQTKGWVAGYPNFREYVEKGLGIHYRKAMYWISIYNSLVESKVPWEKVKDLGWTKLKIIAEVIQPDNVDNWVGIAKSQTALQLGETVKATLTQGKAITDQSTSSTTTTKTFKVHSGQKETIEAAIDKAKTDSNTSVDTVALENICLDYLGGVSMKQRLIKLGLEASLKALEEAFPDASIEVSLPE
ncbi:hypothetical protein [Hyphomicrobium sp.]|uniref:hypothetical protein n=1 Tax=Hyphomicrobium sp. TaxID=82 RepID=UPI001DA53123|nr:hypothetical protein [Hyphomicrobium sp.]MBY0560040.1 hypothetical protein [Hyphomicrobium sp.]